MRNLERLACKRRHLSAPFKLVHSLHVSDKAIPQSLGFTFSPSRERMPHIVRAALCVRNTFLEDLHAGVTPSSQSGDYADVKVVTPYGEIPWRDVSRVSGDLAKRFAVPIFAGYDDG